MSAVSQYKIYCITEAAYVEGWGMAPPTVCYNNNAHTVNGDSVQLIQTISSDEMTIKDRGTLSTESCITLIEGSNTAAYHLAAGTAIAATATTITLEAGGSFAGKAIEIINGTGKNRARIIASMAGAVATVATAWSIVPDTTSAYVVHANSGICPVQTQNNRTHNIKLDTGASSIDNFYRGAYIKIIFGAAAGSLARIVSYDGTLRVATIFPAWKDQVLSTSIYVIYGEGGTAATGDSATITLDGNQSAVVASNQYIEIIGGTGQGQARKIEGISGDVATVAAWTTAPDSTSIYTIFGGWVSIEYENTLRNASISVSIDVDIMSGERCVLDMISPINDLGDAGTNNLMEFSMLSPIRSHSIDVMAKFFRLKVVGMGTALNGDVQTILNSDKSSKIIAQIEDPISRYSDCDLSRAVLCGRTIGNKYSNIGADMSSNLLVSVRSPLDAFGSLMTTQPRQILELMFLNNLVNLSNTKQETQSGGTITSVDNLCTVSTSTGTTGKATMYSLRRLRYVPGMAVCIRFTALFSTPAAGSVQLAGFGDSCDALAIGYNGTDFGILHRRGGKNEIRRLTITAGSTTTESITITLNGQTSAGIAVVNGDGAQGVARKIAAAVSTFAALGGGWDVHEEQGSTVLFVSRVDGSLSGSYSMTATTATGSFASIVAGVSCTETWIYQSDWNRDRAFDDGDLPVLIPTYGNVYEIGLQWLGFGNITFKMENPRTGNLYDLHQIQWPNQSLTPSLGNPNLGLMLATQKTSGATDIVVKSGSMSIFIMGDHNRFLGGRNGAVGTHNTASGTLSAGTVYNILTVRNMMVFNSTRNFSEIQPFFCTLGFKGNATVLRGGQFMLYVSAALNNAGTLTWTARSAPTSTAEFCTNVVSLSGGTELLSIPCGSSFEVVQPLSDVDILIPPGFSLTIGFKPFVQLDGTDSADVSASLSWIQR